MVSFCNHFVIQKQTRKAQHMMPKLQKHLQDAESLNLYKSSVNSDEPYKHDIVYLYC